MKINCYTEWLVRLLKDEQTNVPELLRAVREQSMHFRPDEQLTELDPAILRGRFGPGGAVAVDPFRAGFVLLAIMIDGKKADIALRAWRAWHIPHEGSVLAGWGDDFKAALTRCELTGAPLFGQALKAILEDEALARRVRLVRVCKDTAEIIFDTDNKASRFGRGEQRRLLRRAAEIDGMVIRAIASTLKSGNA